MTVEAHEKLKRHLGISAPTVCLDARRRLARLDEATLERLASDTRPVILRGGLMSARLGDFSTEIPESANGFVDELLWKKAFFEGGSYWEQTSYPLAEATIDDLEKYPWPDLDDPRRYETLEGEVQRLFHNTPTGSPFNRSSADRVPPGPAIDLPAVGPHEVSRPAKPHKVVGACCISREPGLVLAKDLG
jgi:hypothetical protein